MGRWTVYVALQQFCEQDDRPRRLLEVEGFDVRENTLGRRMQPEELVAALQGADAVLAGVEPYDARLLAQLPHLRCISRCGVGTDAIDLETARQRGIIVCTTPDETVEPVAQLTVTMILALARNLPVHCAEAREGLWRKHTGHLLSEWTIGLVGFGRIGRAVERYLRVFGPHVLVSEARLDVGGLTSGAGLVELRSLLTTADLVSLHAARRPEEGPLIGRRELAMMKPGSYLVNTARGFLVDEAALYEALASGHLAGAALDVFATEPYRGALLQLPQVVCTPHVATLTRASRAAMELRCAQNVVGSFAREEAAAGSAQGRPPWLGQPDQREDDAK